MTQQPAFVVPLHAGDPRELVQLEVQYLDLVPLRTDPAPRHIVEKALETAVLTGDLWRWRPNAKVSGAIIVPLVP